MADVFKLRLVIFAVVFFVVSAWSSFQELRYALWGRTVEATVTNVEHRQERVYHRRRSSTTRNVTILTVQFPGPDNRPQTAVLTPNRGHHFTPQQKLSVQCVSGDFGMARLNGQQNWFSVVFFIVGLFAMVGALTWVGMEANRPYTRLRVASDDQPVRPIQPKKKKRVMKPLKPVDDE